MINAINWYSMFYWVTRADDVKGFFDTASDIFLFFVIILLLGTIVVVCIDTGTKADDDDKSATRAIRRIITGFFYVSVILTLITWAGYVFVPSKKDCLLILAGGGTMKFLTTDSSAKQIPKELTTFVVTELKSAAKDAQVSLGIQSAKDKILDEAKTLSAIELMQRMKEDSNYAKIILNK